MHAFFKGPQYQHQPTSERFTTRVVLVLNRSMQLIEDATLEAIEGCNAFTAEFNDSCYAPVRTSSARESNKEDNAFGNRN